MKRFGSLNPKQVTVPGVLIDHLVISGPDHHWQSAGAQFDPGFSGALRVPMEGTRPMGLNKRTIIARRATMELFPGGKINLGIGVPGGIAQVASEGGIAGMITLTSESGTIGGIPAGGHDFGLVRDGDAYVDKPRNLTGTAAAVSTWLLTVPRKSMARAMSM